MRIITKTAVPLLLVCSLLSCRMELETETPFISGGEEVDPEIPEGLICFRPQVQAGPSTRSAVNGTLFPAANDIVMSAWYVPESGPGQPYFQNIVFTKNGSSWSADKYWPLDGELSFMGYSAGNLAFTQQPVLAGDYSYWSMELPADYYQQQEDILLMTSTAGNGYTYGARSSAVSLSFKHALAVLAFTAESTVPWDNDANKGIIINRITVGGVYMDGNLRLCSDGSIIFDHTNSSGSMDVDLPMADGYRVPGTPLDTQSEAFGIGGTGLLVPPQTGSSISVTYTVYQGALSLEKTQEYPISDEWEANSKYVYNLAFDGEKLLLELNPPKYLTFTATSSNERLVVCSDTSGNPYFEYSLDTENWQPVKLFRCGSLENYGLLSETTYDTCGVAFNSEKKVYLRGTNPSPRFMYSLGNLSGNSSTRIKLKSSGYKDSQGNAVYPYLASSDRVDCYGNLVYLLDGQETITSIPKNNNTYGVFFRLFKNQYSLRSAPDLILEMGGANSLMEECYLNCINLEHTPTIWWSTTSTVGADGINTLRACFKGCTKLEETLKRWPPCRGYYAYYQMYSGCTSLKDVTTNPIQYGGKQAFVEMFKNCTAITSGPPIDFQVGGIASDDEFLRMFQGCSSLSYVKISSNVKSSSCYEDWLSGTAATGTLCVKGDEASYLSQLAPSGWTVTTY